MGQRNSKAAFTLIEIMAVVIVLGIMAGIAIPAMQTKTSYGLHTQADVLVATLELARTRAAVTGRPHRVHLSLNRIESENRNLDLADQYLIEWIAPRAAEAPSEATLQGDESAAFGTPGTAPEAAVQLVPTSHATLEAEYEPIPGQFGRRAPLEHEVFIEAIEAPEGVYQQGSLYLYFYADGSADAVQIVLTNAAGHRLTLEVQALSDTVRILEEDAT